MFYIITIIILTLTFNFLLYEFNLIITVLLYIIFYRRIFNILSKKCNKIFKNLISLKKLWKNRTKKRKHFYI